MNAKTTLCCFIVSNELIHVAILTVGTTVKSVLQPSEYGAERLSNSHCHTAGKWSHDSIAGYLVRIVFFVHDTIFRLCLHGKTWNVKGGEMRSRAGTHVESSDAWSVIFKETVTLTMGQCRISPETECVLLDSVLEESYSLFR